MPRAVGGRQERAAEPTRLGMAGAVWQGAVGSHLPPAPGWPCSGPPSPWQTSGQHKPCSGPCGQALGNPRDLLTPTLPSGCLSRMVLLTGDCVVSQGCKGEVWQCLQKQKFALRCSRWDQRGTAVGTSTVLLVPAPLARPLPRPESAHGPPGPARSQGIMA